MTFQKKFKNLINLQKERLEFMEQKKKMMIILVYIKYKVLNFYQKDLLNQIRYYIKMNLNLKQEFMKIFLEKNKEKSKHYVENNMK